MELYEFFDAALSDLEPMADQVPDVLRIERRQRTVRHAGLGAVGAAFVIGAGTLVVAAPWSASPNLTPGAQSMSLAGYGKLVDSTVAGLWPASTGFLAPATVGLHFGDGPAPVSIWTGKPGQRLPAPELVVAEFDQAYARQAETCPKLTAGQSRNEFCTAATLPDGTVVKAENTVAVSFSMKTRPLAQPFQDQAPESFLITLATRANMGATGTESAYWGLESVEVWHGADVETLLVPVEYTKAADGAGTAGMDLTADPDAAELTAIGEAASFQNLLDTAMASGLVPGYSAPQEAVPVPCLPAAQDPRPAATVPAGSAGSVSADPVGPPPSLAAPGVLVITPDCQAAGIGGPAPGLPAKTPAGSADPTPGTSAPGTSAPDTAAPSTPAGTQSAVPTTSPSLAPASAGAAPGN